MIEEEDFLEMFESDICDFCGAELKDKKDKLCPLCSEIPDGIRTLARTREKEQSDFHMANKKAMLIRIIRLKQAMSQKRPQKFLNHLCSNFILLLESSEYDKFENVCQEAMPLDEAVDRVLERYKQGIDDRLCEALDALRWSIKRSPEWPEVQRYVSDTRIEDSHRVGSFCRTCGERNQNLTMMGTCQACAMINDALGREPDLGRMFEQEETGDE